MADSDTTGKGPRKRASRKSPSSSLTDAVGVESPRKSTEAPKKSSNPEPDGELLNLIGRGVVPPILNDPERRREMGLPADEDTPGRYMFELNIQFRGGLGEASKAFLKLCQEEFGNDRPPVAISKSYYRVRLSVKQWRELLKVDDDHAKQDPALRIIYKLWPDFKVKALMDRSVATVKADAAFKSYSATGSGITWAVIDSGIDGDHAHFGSKGDKERSVIHHPSVEELHRDYTEEGENDAGPGGDAGSEEQAEHARQKHRDSALVDGLGHGTHVAGIIAGGLPSDAIAYPEPRGYDLRLMSVAAADGLVNEGRNLVIVALVGTDLHIRIFGASGKKVVDKAENELVSGETLTALKEQLNPIPDEPGLSKERKQKIIGDATSIAGHTQSRRKRKIRYAVYEQVFEADPQGHRIWDKQPVQRKLRNPEALHGVAPNCTLVSLKVLDKEGKGHVSDIMRALVYVRDELNDDPKMLRVHGVNLSVGYDFDAQMFACGQSPLCVEVDRLVKSGVVVVAAAGNTGYGSVNASERQMKVGLSNTINDPGNASLAITVGSTHRDAPHTYGVSFFSSKGPTADGRLKPDLVAPGERITSCAAKAKREKVGIDVDEDVATYVDDSGTSMAAPHVSGAIAAFLSIRREFIQRPEEVKRIFLESATSLGRERYFEGHGLVDLMRAIQSV